MTSYVPHNGELDLSFAALEFKPEQIESGDDWVAAGAVPVQIAHSRLSDAGAVLARFSLTHQLLDALYLELGSRPIRQTTQKDNLVRAANAMSFHALGIRIVNCSASELGDIGVHLSLRSSSCFRIAEFAAHQRDAAMREARRLTNDTVLALVLWRVFMSVSACGMDLAQGGGVSECLGMWDAVRSSAKAFDVTWLPTDDERDAAGALTADSQWRRTEAARLLASPELHKAVVRWMSLPCTDKLISIIAPLDFLRPAWLERTLGSGQEHRGLSAKEEAEARGDPYRDIKKLAAEVKAKHKPVPDAARRIRDGSASSGASEFDGCSAWEPEVHDDWTSVPPSPSHVITAPSPSPDLEPRPYKRSADAALEAPDSKRRVTDWLHDSHTSQGSGHAGPSVFPGSYVDISTVGDNDAESSSSPAAQVAPHHDSDSASCRDDTTEAHVESPFSSADDLRKWLSRHGCLLDPALLAPDDEPQPDSSAHADVSEGSLDVVHRGSAQDGVDGSATPDAGAQDDEARIKQVEGETVASAYATGQDEDETVVSAYETAQVENETIASAYAAAEGTHIDEVDKSADEPYDDTLDAEGENESEWLNGA